MNPCDPDYLLARGYAFVTRAARTRRAKVEPRPRLAMIRGVLSAAPLLLAAWAARAQTPSAADAGRAASVEPSTRRVIVVVLATEGVDPETADALSELLIGEIAARGGVSIVGREELLARLGNDERHALECVSTATCLGRLGVELGVDEIVAGTVARRDARWTFNVDRVDIASGTLVGRVRRAVDGDAGALAEAVQRSVPSLYERVVRPATLIVEADVRGANIVVGGRIVGRWDGEPIRVTDLPPGRHEVRVRVRGTPDWVRVVDVAEGATVQLQAAVRPPSARAPRTRGMSVLVWIGGATALVGVGTAFVFGMSSGARPDMGRTRAQNVEFAEARRRDALVANVSLGVAGAGLVTGVVGLLLFGGAEDDPRVEVTAGCAPGDCGLRFGGRF